MKWPRNSWFVFWLGGCIMAQTALGVIGANVAVCFGAGIVAGVAYEHLRIRQWLAGVNRELRRIRG